MNEAPTTADVTIREVPGVVLSYAVFPRWGVFLRGRQVGLIENHPEMAGGCVVTVGDRWEHRSTFALASIRAKCLAVAFWRQRPNLDLTGTLAERDVTQAPFRSTVKRCKIMGGNSRYRI